MWISVKDKMPDKNQEVFVKIGDVYGVAYYTMHRGFEVDSSAYDILCDDDSGLHVEFIAEVTHWMAIPELRDENKPIRCTYQYCSQQRKNVCTASEICSSRLD